MGGQVGFFSIQICFLSFHSINFVLLGLYDWNGLTVSIRIMHSNHNVQNCQHAPLLSYQFKPAQVKSCKTLLVEHNYMECDDTLYLPECIVSCSIVQNSLQLCYALCLVTTVTIKNRLSMQYVSLHDLPVCIHYFSTTLQYLCTNHKITSNQINI